MTTIYQLIRWNQHQIINHTGSSFTSAISGEYYDYGFFNLYSDSKTTNTTVLTSSNANYDKEVTTTLKVKQNFSPVIIADLVKDGNNTTRALYSYLSTNGPMTNGSISNNLEYSNLRYLHKVAFVNG